MAHGVPTPDNVELEFRKHYLVVGSIRAAARHVKIPATTGQELANRANADPEFVRARAELYARVIPDAERVLVNGIEIAFEKLEQGSESPVDPGPQYLRGIADAVKVLSLIRKDGAGHGNDAPAEVHVHLKGEPDESEPG